MESLRRRLDAGDKVPALATEYERLTDEEDEVANWLWTQRQDGLQQAFAAYRERVKHGT